MHNIGEFMDIITKNFGERLKAYRRANNMTQERFAEMIDINLRQLARIEAGESFVSSKTLIKICKTLNVAPNMLFNFDVEKERFNNNEVNNLHYNVMPSSNITSEAEGFEELKNNIHKISNDKKKIEYINLAYESLFEKKALEDLKIMIKGIELTK